MNRHNQSSSNLHEHQLELHRQTKPELTHCPKTLCIDHMRTSCLSSSRVPRRFTIAGTKQPRKTGVWKWQVLRIIFEFCTCP
jgi:hypothetical protein